jgi:hypothetical protein
MQGCNPSAELEAGAGGPWKHGRRLPCDNEQRNTPMTLTIQFPPDVEAGLLSQAKAEGVDVSDYVQNLVRERISEKASAAEVFRPAAELTPEERLVHLRKFIESHAGNTVVLTDEAMDRESIYGDRGL